MNIPLAELQKATRLTREGKLLEATATIQRALGGADRSPQASFFAPPLADAQARVVARTADITDVPFRELLARPEPPIPRTTAKPPSFEAHRFAFGGAMYTYRLYVPPRSDDTALPVVVMLHGCTQDAADFAAGTTMNELAAQRGCIVVYPEQLVRANRMRCWNWFDPAHQQRGRGEPAMIAALATHVVQRCQGDGRRVYVAGLSAGGAMATLVAQLYPDVFAAVGVHSGLPAGVARDVTSAHAAMRSAAGKPRAAAAAAAAVPTIVFHGRSDRIVHPHNGRLVIEEALASAEAAGIALEREQQQLTVAGRVATRTVYRDADQVARCEHWEIAAAAHAWSGGSTAGTYTDAAGPNASRAMFDFFHAHSLATQHPGVDTR